MPTRLHALRNSIIREARALFEDPVPNILAGFTVAIVALPLALAFGLIAFGPDYGPAAGLWSAIIVGFLASLLGGAPYAITGPTGVLAVFTAGLVLNHGGFTSPDAILFGFFAVALSGIFQILFGAARFGSVIELIPYPVVTGFMNGIAVIILWSGVKEILSPTNAGLGASAWRAVIDFAQGRGPSAVYAAAAVAGVAVALIYVYPRLTRVLPEGGMRSFLVRVPGSLIALVTLTVAALVLPLLSGVRHIEALPRGLPSFALDFGFFVRHPEWTTDLVLGALALAAISSMDTLLTCVIADGVTGTQHKSNRELVAQGIGNSVSGVFGAAQACGAAVRTMVNVKNGGRTRLSGVTHSLVLVAVLFIGASYAALVPLAVLSGILITTALGMVEWRSIFEMHKSPKSDTGVMLVTAGVVVYSGLIEAVVVGVVLAAVLHVRRITALAEYVGEPEWTGSAREGLEGLERDVLVYEVRGPLFFGAAARFTRTFERADLKTYRVVIFRMNAVATIDETGMRALEVAVARLQRNGQTIILSHVPVDAQRKLERFGLAARIGAENVVPRFSDAVTRARVIAGAQPPADASRGAS